MAKVDSGEAARDDSDLPPDSILVPITQETLWQDLNSAYDSEDSTKGSTNPKSYSNPFPWSKTSSASNRVAATNLNATTSVPIIGLPAKIQRTGFIACHRPPSIFPRVRRSGSGSGSKKSALADSEPGSPKVSCLGHVLSQRERERRRVQRHGEKEKENEDRAVTCCAGFLHCGGGGGDKKKRSELRRSLSENSRPAKAAEEVKKASEGRRGKKGESKKLSKEELTPRSTEGLEVDDAPPPAIAAMKKFSSGRRAASWGEEAAAAAVVVV